MDVPTTTRRTLIGGLAASAIAGPLLAAARPAENGAHRAFSPGQPHGELFAVAVIHLVEQPLRFLGRVHLEGKEYLSAENLYVPLANDNDEPAFVMGLCRYVPRNRDAEATWENQLASLPGGLL